MATVAAMRLLAHQGGWDEILFVLAPLLLFGGLLALARKRVGEIEQDEADRGGAEPREERKSPDPS
jgi:hypothetical protein